MFDKSMSNLSDIGLAPILNAYNFSKVDFTFTSNIFEGTYRIFGQKKMLLFDKLYVERLK